MTRERWSFSKMQKYRRCGEQYRREVLEKEYPPPTSAMARGTAVHFVAAEGHLRQLKARAERPSDPKSIVLRESLPTEDEAADMAATRFELERTQSGISAATDEQDTTPEKVIGRDKDTAVRMGRYYVSRVAPFRDPLYVEQRVEIEPADSNIRL